MNEEKKLPAPVPLIPPHPVDRVSHDDINRALAVGLTPFATVNGGTVPIFSPDQLLGRHADDYRYRLRSHIAKQDWGSLCTLLRQEIERQEALEKDGLRISQADRSLLSKQKAHVIIWGYTALCAERDERDTLAKMASSYRQAAQAAVNLHLVLHNDPRQINGVPLPLARAAHAAEHERHTDSLGSAFTSQKSPAATVLGDFVMSWLVGLMPDGLWILDSENRRYPYFAERLSLADLERLSSVLEQAACFTDFIVTRGINGVIKANTDPKAIVQRDVLRVWLVQQGRELGLGPAALADLLTDYRVGSLKGTREKLIRSLKNSEQDWNYQYGAIPVPLTV